MRNIFTAPLVLAVVLMASDLVATAGDWLTLPGQFTHDPETGLRISQYAPSPSPTAPLATDFRSSGYSNTRSSLNYGQSADNYHRVEQWGPPVQPYGEWRFPNRPYSAPYSQWGAPFAGLGGFGSGGFGGGYGPGGLGPGAYGPGYPGGYQPGLPPSGYDGRPAVPGQPQSGADPFNPYSTGTGSVNPNAPVLDGYHPVYRD